MRAAPPFALALALAGCGLQSPTRVDGGAAGGAAAGGTTTAGGAGNPSAGGTGTGGGTGTAGGGMPAPRWVFTELLAAGPRFLSVAGRSAGDFWVVSDDGRLRQWEDGGLADRFMQPNLQSVAVTGGGEVFAVSTTAMHACVTDCSSPTPAFSTQPPDPSATEMTGVCTHPVHGTFAVGYDDFGFMSGNSAVFFYRSGLWSRLHYISNVRGLKSCFITADGVARSPGIDGVLRSRSDGGYFEDDPIPGSAQVQWWAGAAVDAGMIVGGAGWKIRTSATGALHSWNAISDPMDDGGSVRAMANLGASDDVVAGGTFVAGRSLLVRRNGTWLPVVFPMHVYGLYGVDARHFIAVGEALDGGGGRIVSAELR